MPDFDGLPILLTQVAGFFTIVVFVYAMIVLVARTLHRFLPATTPPRDPAMDAVRTRLATGEIDEAEFDRLRSTLQSR
jgi:uncharacterized membrane protein